jgi:hypothetical protein
MTASAGPALKRLYADFRDRVAFVTLYVREAHPGERYPQPETFESKLAHARAYQVRDAIPWPVAVDDVEGSLHRALDAKPNAAYIMNVDGNAAFRTLWSNDEQVLREALEATAARPHGTVGQSEAKLVPMLKGMGEMYEVLGSAGQEARRDVGRQVPPLYAMARLAALFRPLPPLGRGIAAVAATLLALAAGIGGIRWAVKHQAQGQYGIDKAMWSGR